jgi:hypothetical protein
VYVGTTLSYLFLVALTPPCTPPESRALLIYRRHYLKRAGSLRFPSGWLIGQRCFASNLSSLGTESGAFKGDALMVLDPV